MLKFKLLVVLLMSFAALLIVSSTFAQTISAEDVYVLTYEKNIYRIDPETATATFVCKAQVGAHIGDIAVDSDGNFWGLHDTHGLFRIYNPTQGVCGGAQKTLITDTNGERLSGTEIGIEFGPDGKLYLAVRNARKLYSVNLDTGVATLIGPTGYNTGSGFTFDDQGRLFMIHGTCGFCANHLYEINPETGSPTYMFNLGVYKVYGLAFSGGALYGYKGYTQFEIDISSSSTLNYRTLDLWVDSNTPQIWGSTRLPISNSPPIADAGPDQLVQAIYADGTSPVTLDASASSDPDGDSLDYSWLEGDVLIATGEVVDVILGLGEHLITLEVSDRSEFDSDELIVNVVATPKNIADLVVDFIVNGDIPEEIGDKLLDDLFSAEENIAIGKTDKAIQDLDTFKHNVDKERDKENISEEVATILLGAADATIGNL